MNRMNRKPDKQPIEKGDLEKEPEEPHHSEDAEHIRSESQTAQDREHTIRGGDNRTAPMKEFPT